MTNLTLNDPILSIRILEVGSNWIIEKTYPQSSQNAQLYICTSVYQVEKTMNELFMEAIAIAKEPIPEEEPIDDVLPF